MEANYDFPINKLQALNREYESFIKKFSTLSSVQLLEETKQRVDHESFQTLKSKIVDKGVIDFNDLKYICGYTEFIRNYNISKEPLQLEFREEKNRAYLLIPIQQSFIIKLSIDSKIVWVHDEQWAKERFVDKKPNSGPYLCGQLLGLSKFVSLSKEMSSKTSKEQALVALGLKGYVAFDKPGYLYLVCADTNDNILRLAKPKVPILYKIQENSVWATAQHFGENSIPGFTSGGKSEVVINTFLIDAVDITDLDKKGVKLFVLD